MMARRPAKSLVYLYYLNQLKEVPEVSIVLFALIEADGRGALRSAKCPDLSWITHLK